MKSLVILLRRELWEHPALYVTPLVIGSFVLLSVLVGLIQGVGAGAGLTVVVTGVATLGDLQQGAGIGMLLSVLAPLFLFGFLAATFFYLLDALYAERRERTILFFKSLPVTDTATVVSKAVTALVLVPAITLVVLMATQLLALLLLGLGALAAGANPLVSLWHPMSLIESWLLAVYGAAALSLWYAPFAGWLLLASAWARKAVFLWAISPLLLGQVERLMTGRSRLLEAIAAQAGDFFQVAFAGDRLAVFRQLEDSDAQSMASLITRLDLVGLADPASLLAAAQLWWGLAITGAFLAAAVGLRRYRDST
jgi:ABC-2 type transport system permease protein